MVKIDFKKEMKQFYNPGLKTVSIVDVPVMNYIMIDGSGDPNNSPQFQETMNALYGIAYTLKFAMKDDPPKGYFEFVVPPLEGLWWTDPPPFDSKAKDKWLWTMMLMQPDFITAKMIQNTVIVLKKKKPSAALSDVRLDTLDEGRCVQIMHIGPYDREEKTIDKLHSFAQDNGYTLTGKHHEIYLSDPRRMPPERLKTIIRQPVEKL